MNGRIERSSELELAIYSEPNYASVEFVFTETRAAKLKKFAKDALLVVAFYGGLWLIWWGVARAL